MFLAAKTAIATAGKSLVINLALMKRKLIWIMLNEKIVSVLRDKHFQFEKVCIFIGARYLEVTPG